MTNFAAMDAEPDVYVGKPITIDTPPPSPDDEAFSVWIGTRCVFRVTFAETDSLDIRDFIQRIHHDGREQVLEAMRAVLTQGDIDEVEARLAAVPEREGEGFSSETLRVVLARNSPSRSATRGSQIEAVERPSSR